MLYPSPRNPTLPLSSFFTLSKACIQHEIFLNRHRFVLMVRWCVAFCLISSIIHQEKPRKHDSHSYKCITSPPPFKIQTNKIRINDYSSFSHAVPSFHVVCLHATRHKKTQTKVSLEKKSNKNTDHVLCAMHKSLYTLQLPITG